MIAQVHRPFSMTWQVTFAALLVGLSVGACARGGPSSLQLDRASAGNGGLVNQPLSGVGHGAGGTGARVIPIAGTPDDFRRLTTDVAYFTADSAVLTEDAQEVLARQAAWLQQYRSRLVTIEGHADERGTREYNISLGSRVTAARIRTVSYGKERPLATCDDIACWSRNRRSQTVPS
jgi:peptidoglycan-associated lipoprotein